MPSVQSNEVGYYLLKYELWRPREGKKIMDENQAISFEHLNSEDTSGHLSS